MYIMIKLKTPTQTTLTMTYEVLANLKPVDTAKSHNTSSMFHHVSKHWPFSRKAGSVFALQDLCTSDVLTLIQITHFHATNLNLLWESQNSAVMVGSQPHFVSVYLP